MNLSNVKGCHLVARCSIRCVLGNISRCSDIHKSLPVFPPTLHLHLHPHLHPHLHLYLRGHASSINRATTPIKIQFSFIVSVGMTVLMFFLFGKPYKRGFFCNDESLNHPFHTSTVTSTMLYVIGLFLPICGVSHLPRFVIFRYAEEEKCKTSNLSTTNFVDRFSYSRG